MKTELTTNNDIVITITQKDVSMAIGKVVDKWLIDLAGDISCVELAGINPDVIKEKLITSAKLGQFTKSLMTIDMDSLIGESQIFSTRNILKSIPQSMKKNVDRQIDRWNFSIYDSGIHGVDDLPSYSIKFDTLESREKVKQLLFDNGIHLYEMEDNSGYMDDEDDWDDE